MTQKEELLREGGVVHAAILVQPTKPGKARERCNTIQDRIVPILKKQTGFVDETVGLWTVEA